MSKTKQTNGVTQPKEGQQKQEWVFIPLSKELILKSTDKYILFKIGDGATSIVSAVFKRKKETEEKVFLSVPPEYNFGCQVREYDNKQRKYVSVKKWDVKAGDMKELLSKLEDKKQEDLPDDDLPF